MPVRASDLPAALGADRIDRLFANGPSIGDRSAHQPHPFVDSPDVEAEVLFNDVAHGDAFAGLGVRHQRFAREAVSQI